MPFLFSWLFGIHFMLVSNTFIIISVVTFRFFYMKVMVDAEHLCQFCCKSEKRRNVDGLEMCARCAIRYSDVCQTYKARVSSQISTAGWTVELVTHASAEENFPDTRRPLFYILCKKGRVEITTAIDRVAFFAAVSRLQSDMQSPKRNMNRSKKSTRRGKYNS